MGICGQSTSQAASLSGVIPQVDMDTGLVDFFTFVFLLSGKYRFQRRNSRHCHGKILVYDALCSKLLLLLVFGCSLRCVSFVGEQVAVWWTGLSCSVHQRLCEYDPRRKLALSSLCSAYFTNFLKSVSVGASVSSAGMPPCRKFAGSDKN